jgi:hypothetical protein
MAISKIAHESSSLSVPANSDQSDTPTRAYWLSISLSRNIAVRIRQMCIFSNWVIFWALL